MAAAWRGDYYREKVVYLSQDKSSLHYFSNSPSLVLHSISLTDSSLLKGTPLFTQTPISGDLLQDLNISLGLTKPRDINRYLPIIQRDLIVVNPSRDHFSIYRLSKPDQSIIQFKKTDSILFLSESKDCNHISVFSLYYN